MKKIVGPVLFCLFAISVAYPTSKPKLVVLLSVDQMRGDYLERFEHDFIGGFRRLWSEGIAYTHADLNYATTETGPGHATLSTGTYPAKNGILGNEWIEPDTRNEMYCVADTTAQPVEGLGGKMSPRNLLTTALGDWLKAASPQSKVISASVKDRAAILMGGKRPDKAFWYDGRTGSMVTSSYYMNSLPAYVKAFNASGWIEKNVPDAWTRLLPEKAYDRFGPDEFEGEGLWNGTTTFPHAFAKEKKADQLRTSPYGDLLTLAFAQEAVVAEKLGQGRATDLLTISLSCTDNVGHHYGPSSHELHDQLIRIDRGLGEFLAFLDKQLGKENYIVALSADHGVCPLPEHRSRVEHKEGRRIDYNTAIRTALPRAMQASMEEWKISEPLVEKNAFLNYSAAAKAGIDSTTLERRVREMYLKLDGVADIFFRRELLSPSTPDRPYLSKFRNSYNPARGEDFQILACEFCLFSTRKTGSTHGSAHRYDSHVPLVFWGSMFKAQRIAREAHSADLAPTVATLLGIPFPAGIDGVPLPEVK